MCFYLPTSTTRGVAFVCAEKAFCAALETCVAREMSVYLIGALVVASRED
jgi:hypothetical protein